MFNFFKSNQDKQLSALNVEHSDNVNLIKAESALVEVQRQLLAANKTTQPEQNIINAFTALNNIITAGAFKSCEHSLILADHVVVLKFDAKGGLIGVQSEHVQ